MLIILIFSSFFLLNNAKDTTFEEKHLLLCIKTIVLKYFSTNTLVLSSEDQHYSDVENVLAKKLHSTEVWSVVVSRPSGEHFSGFVEEQKLIKHDYYVILSYGQTEDEVMDDVLNKIQHLSYYDAWNPRAKFLISILLLKDDYNSSKIAEQLFREMWWWKILDSVVLIKDSEEDKSLKKYDLYAWFPYQDNGKCLTVEEVTVLDSWVMDGRGFLRNNAHLFPTKIRNNMHNCLITASTFPIDLVVGPYNNDTKSKIYEEAYNSGLEIELIKFVTHKLNFTLKFRPPPPNNERWGRLLEDGTVTGLAGDVVYEKSDFVFGAFPLHPNLLKIMDATVWYYRDDWVWWVPCAKKIPRWKSIVMVFHVEAWLGLTFSFILAVIFAICLANHVQKEYREYKYIYACIQNMWAVILGVSLVSLPRTTPLRTFFIFWISYGLCINTIFQAFLTTFLIEPGRDRQLNSIEEILDAKIKYGYNPGFDIIFQGSSDTLAKTIFTNRMECHEANDPPCLDWMAYHANFSLLCSTALLQYILSKEYLDENGNPLICQAGGVFFPVTYVTYMTKWNPLLNQFNDKLTRAVENGFIDSWIEMILHKQRVHAAKIRRKVVTGDYFHLSLEHSQGMFAILVPGFTLSLFAFLAEIVCSKLFSRSKPKHNRQSDRTPYFYEQYGYFD